MHRTFGSCSMGEVDEEGFNWETGEYETADSSGGLSDAGADVLTNAIRGLTSIGTSIINAVGGGTTNATGATPGTPGRVIVQPARAGMDPVVLAAIGIPAALVAVALMRGKK